MYRTISHIQGPGESPSYHKLVLFQFYIDRGRATSFVACSMPELLLILHAMVQPRAAHDATLSTLEQKRSTLEAKTPHLALEGVRS